MSLPEQDKSFVSKTEDGGKYHHLLGGRVAEQLVLDDISTGASNDLERATATARKHGHSLWFQQEAWANCLWQRPERSIS